MADYDGEIIIHARIDTDDLENDASNLSNTITDKLSVQKKILANLRQQYNDFISGLTKTPEQFGIEKMLQRETAELNKNISSLSKLEETYNLLKNSKNMIVDKQSLENFQNLEKQVNSFKININETTQRIERLKDRLSEIKLNPEAQTSVLKLQEKIINTSNKINSSFSNTSKSILTNISKSMLSVGNIISKGFSLLLLPIKSVVNLIMSVGRQILNIAKTAFILHGIRTGFKGISDTIANVISADNQFITSLNQIKSNLITAFYPIYQYILPSLHALMGALSTASSYLAQFISHLFGQDYKAMQQGAQSFINTANAADASSKSINKNKNKFSELGKNIKKTTGELANFDKINVLHLENNTPKPIKSKDKGAGFVFSPTSNLDAGYNNFLKQFDAFREKLMAKMKPTIDSFNELGETVKVKLGGFASQAIRDFDTEFLEPATDYLLGTAIPKFNNITKNMIENTNWDNLNTSLANFWKALEPFNETIGNGLLWFYEKAIAPLTEWATGELLPAALDAVIGALEFLNPIAQKAGEYLGFLWDNFLAPVAEWTGGVIVSVLENIGKALDAIGKWIDKNDWFLEGAAALITGITTATLLYNAALWGTSAGPGLITALFNVAKGVWAFTTALLANPITWWIIGIGSVIAVLILLAKHWDEVKEAASKSMEWIQDKSQILGNKLKDIWDRTIGGIIDKFRVLMDKLREWGDNLKSIFGGFNFRNIVPNNIGSGRPFRIPGFAQGAVLKGGDPMLAYLNDQPKGQTNIETPLNTMIDAFNTALERNRGTINNNLVVQAEGDINSIVSLLNFRIKQQDQIIGNNYIQDGVFL